MKIARATHQRRVEQHQGHWMGPLTVAVLCCLLVAAPTGKLQDAVDYCEEIL